MHTINNEQLNEFEVEILKRMLSEFITFSEIAIEQVNSADITRDKSPCFCITKFYINSKTKIPPLPERVPLRIEIRRENLAPLIVLLHIKDGVVYELEYFNADSSEMDLDVLKNYYELILEI